MAIVNEIKKGVWQHIYQLVQPFKRTLWWIFGISLLTTGLSLLEPLIYREAVNDIAGLFVQKARNEVKKELGMEPETHEHPGKSVLSARHKVHRVKEPHRKDHVAPRTPHEALQTLLWAVALLLVINIAGLICWIIGERLNVRLSCNIENRFLRQTFAHVLRLPLSFFSKRSSAALHKQIDQSEEVSGTVSVFTKDILPEVISLVGILVIMFWQNYTLALLSLSVIPFYLFITIRSTKKLEMSLAGYYEKWEEVSARMQDALGGIKTVKLSGAEDREVKRLDEQAAGAYADYTKRTLLANRYTFWQTLLTHLSTALVLSYGGYLALEHKLTPGDVVMFVAYLDMLYAPIDKLAGIWAEVQQNIASIGRAFKLLDNTTEEVRGKELELKQGTVQFRDVRFGYTPEREVLKGLSFAALPGKVTALVGTSGAGKTTTVDLLLKLFEPQSGEILIDGQPLSSLDASSVRREIGMVTADGAVFRGNLVDNIRYKNARASVAEVQAAAYAAGMEGTLRRLPEGLETMVGEGGFGLSVGERQRVQIARVIIAKPRILVMDEATANLDYATEAEVKKTIDELRKESTVIIIAHRYSMVKDADHVIVLDAGRVREEGTPAELIEQGGWFADFAAAGNEEESGDEEEADMEEDMEEEVEEEEDDDVEEED